MNMRAYAWIHFAAATLVQTSMHRRAVETADTMLKDFDTRFDPEGEATVPAEVEGIRDRLVALEERPNADLEEIRAEIGNLASDLDAKFNGLREGMASDLNALSGRVDQLEEA